MNIINQQTTKRSTL